MAGMTQSQFKIFQYLCTHGIKSIPQLSNEVGFPRTQTYAMLRSMEKKGAVKLINHKPFKFEAISIEEFLEKRIMLEYKKLMDLEEILTGLNKEPPLQKIGSHYEIPN